MATLGLNAATLIAADKQQVGESGLHSTPEQIWENTGRMEKHMLPLPVDQKLVATATATYVCDPLDHAGQMTINEPGEWRGVGQRAKRTGVLRFNLGHMESTMNKKRGWKL